MSSSSDEYYDPPDRQLTQIDDNPQESVFLHDGNEVQLLDPITDHQRDEESTQLLTDDLQTNQDAPHQDKENVEKSHDPTADQSDPRCTESCDNIGQSDIPTTVVDEMDSYVNQLKTEPDLDPDAKSHDPELESDNKPVSCDSIVEQSSPSLEQKDNPCDENDQCSSKLSDGQCVQNDQAVDQTGQLVQSPEGQHDEHDRLIDIMVQISNNTDNVNQAVTKTGINGDSDSQVQASTEEPDNLCDQSDIEHDLQKSKSQDNADDKLTDDYFTQIAHSNKAEGERMSRDIDLDIEMFDFDITCQSVNLDLEADVYIPDNTERQCDAVFDQDQSTEKLPEINDDIKSASPPEIDANVNKVSNDRPENNNLEAFDTVSSQINGAKEVTYDFQDNLLDINREGNDDKQDSFEPSQPASEDTKGKRHRFSTSSSEGTEPFSMVTLRNNKQQDPNTEHLIESTVIKQNDEYSADLPDSIGQKPESEFILNTESVDTKKACDKGPLTHTAQNTCNQDTTNTHDICHDHFGLTDKPSDRPIKEATSDKNARSTCQPHTNLTDDTNNDSECTYQINNVDHVEDSVFIEKDLKNHEPDVAFLQNLDKSCLEDFLLDFKDEMAKIGVRSASLDSYVATSTVRLGSSSSSQKDMLISQRNRQPWTSAPSNSDTRTIRIMRGSSISSDHSLPNLDNTSTNKIHKVEQNGTRKSESEDRTRNKTAKNTMISKSSVDHTEGISKMDSTSDKSSADYTESISKMDSTSDDNKSNPNSPGRRSRTSRSNTIASDRRLVPAGGPSLDSVQGKTVMDLLQDIGKKLKEEKQLRERAEDWADFLALELEAHIDARTHAEDRYFYCRELLQKQKEKHKKLVEDHKELLLEIRDITKETGHVKANTSQPVNSEVPKNIAILRRNKYTGDRNAMLAKRNAMLIRGSKIRESTEDSESGEDVKSTSATQNGGLVKNMNDIKQKWQHSYEQKKEKGISLGDPKKKDLSDTGINITDLVTPNADEQDGLKHERVTHIYNTSTPKRAQSHGASRTQSHGASRTQSHGAARTQPHGASRTQSHGASRTVVRPPDRITNGSVEDSSENQNQNQESNTEQKVNVRAFTNMWESKFTKASPSKTGSLSRRTSSTGSYDNEHEHDVSNASIASTASYKSTQSKKENSPPYSGMLRSLSKESRRDKNDNLEIISDDDEDLELDYLSAQEEPDVDIPQAEGVLTESINKKQAFNMWENFAVTANNDDSPNSTKVSRNLSFSKSVSKARAKFQAFSSSNSTRSPSTETDATNNKNSSFGRTRQYSSLRGDTTRWQPK